MLFRSIEAKFPLGDAIDGELAAVGAAALARTRGGKLHCIEPLGGKLQKRWSADVPIPPVGPPATQGRSLWLAASDGQVQGIQLSDGAKGPAWQARRALAGGPWNVGGQIVVEAADGSLLLVDPADGR